jgi:hypothetical protein
MKATSLIELAKVDTSAKTLEKIETAINLRNSDVSTFVSDLSTSGTADADLWAGLITQGNYLKNNDKNFKLNGVNLVYSSIKILNHISKLSNPHKSLLNFPE